MELLERSSFLDALAGYAAEARGGSGRLVLVSGESGIGKTALVEAFQAQLHGARWLWGACDGLLTPRPLGPLFDIAAQAGGQLSELCGQGAGPDRLFGAFLAELDSPAALTVAVIEDVHWADEATIDLLRFAGRRLGRMRALVLVTYRDDELSDDPLRLLLGDLAAHRATRRMGLPPLSDDAVRALAGQRDLDAAQLCRVTGGNPFLVCEAIEAGWPAVPPTVRDVVGARLARASAPVREALQAAAVIGTSVDREVLASVAGGSAALLDDCLRTGLLTADAGCLLFRHELVRMAVEEAIGPHRRGELHARVLAVLQDSGNTDPAVLAHHAEGAGDVAAIGRYAAEAARRSAALGAHREAAAQYQRALRYPGTADLPGPGRPAGRALGRIRAARPAGGRRSGAARRPGDPARARRHPARRGGPEHALGHSVAAVPGGREHPGHRGVAPGFAAAAARPGTGDGAALGGHRQVEQGTAGRGPRRRRPDARPRQAAGPG